MAHAVDDRKIFVDQMTADSFLQGCAEIAEHADKSHGSSGDALGGDINGK